jgi:homopolymeric O-antigen transport system ATP-binding protein
VTASRSIQFESVWKSYPSWVTRGPDTLREALRRRIPGRALPRERRWALQDVSCTFESGIATGIIGQNGAGKSTMLRLASGVGAATRGRILLPVNTASVLSLGYVFDPTLTGEENALTASLMAGMTAAQSRAVLPAVLEFAELEAFAEAPLRTYSDGMRLRLAFGVVAQSTPEALLLDEVMAVGDLRFQTKCLERIGEMRAAGTTVVFASHSLEQVAEQCDRALWLDGGVVRLHAEAQAVVQAYREAMESETVARTPSEAGGPHEANLELGRNRLGSQEATIEGVQIVVRPSAVEHEAGTFVEFKLGLLAQEEVMAPIMVVTIRRADDAVVCVDLSTERSGFPVASLAGRMEVTLTFEDLRLSPGKYVVDVGVYERSWRYAYDLHLSAYSFEVPGATRTQGVYLPAHAWGISQP